MGSYNIGDIVEGKVTGVEDYGIFLSLKNGESGLIHISEISHSFVRNVNDYANSGDVLEAKVISIEANGHYKLSIKELKDDLKHHNLSMHETKTGFNTLKERLDEWIDEYKI